MIAKLIHKNDYYYCSECRMRQKLQSYCDFCGAIFSNYEEELIKESEDNYFGENVSRNYLDN